MSLKVFNTNRHSSENQSVNLINIVAFKQNDVFAFPGHLILFVIAQNNYQHKKVHASDQWRDIDNIEHYSKRLLLK